MTLEEVIEYYGNQSKVARALHISRAALTEWKKRGYVPLVQQYRLEKITKGKLKAEDEVNLNITK